MRNREVCHIPIRYLCYLLKTVWQLSCHLLQLLDPLYFDQAMSLVRRFQWPRGLRCRTSAACPLRMRIRNPSGVWMSVCCECSVLSGRVLCDKLITRPEESYRVWCVWVWSRNLVNEEALTHWGLWRPQKCPSSGQTIVSLSSAYRLVEWLGFIVFSAEGNEFISVI
jgi:hypothetical protein